ncbi:MAG: hypothetical protein COT25_03930 [Candidatus Kerfeldbacteria bacterium CG08_land_8_20_14_0_20_42_7]|uniref:HTH cro/C1-type domain-containing protein n=1 Tax=Candidatus Kerfeldbacteria bacterium CG08_land_8_20_14_0_20_42_7 TaxID=2014245 RepID=A0A2H0YS66_9BACT|nr:MAG: hypothetical protein COT25_03930 [Candidatus Kerfeldbacteria bacterium CG08_land_8_20_14_0_20_42_7]
MEDLIPRSHPNRIRFFRLQQGYTLKEVAVLLHCSARSVIRWEQGKQNPPIEAVIAISLLLQTPFETLFGKQIALCRQQLSASIAALSDTRTSRYAAGTYERNRTNPSKQSQGVQDTASDQRRDACTSDRSSTTDDLGMAEGRLCSQIG